MRFNQHKEAQSMDTRVRKVFLYLPLNLLLAGEDTGGTSETRWLEYASIDELYLSGKWRCTRWYND